MVDSQLRPQGVTDRAVLAAMGSVAREDFVPAEVRPLAYIDRSLELGGGHVQPPPAFLGQLLTAMAPVPGERALVVGGSGYSAAVLVRIGCEVTAVVDSPEIAARSRSLGIAAEQGPLESGWTAGAPYDLILIDGAIEHVPEAFIDQLADGGRLGAGLIERGVSRLIVGRKAGGAFGYFSIGDSGIAPLPGFSRPRAFTF
jgi:protein-L-isoaspartate(D-aspartate) O-methyltransferase